ncbi:MAG: hypothetical protein WKF75_18245 [Singulisphaera sp.]
MIASGRGALPETLGRAGLLIPLPERLTPATRFLLTPEEVAPWVEAVIVGDDAASYGEQSRRALEERAGPRRRWGPGRGLFSGILAHPGPSIRPSPRRTKAAVLVPYFDGIDQECEQGLHQLEQAGIRVVRRGGSSAIDVARNVLAAEALHDAAEAMLFIDSDIGFDPLDALRLLARPEPVVAGVYAKKGRRAMASAFADEVAEAHFGDGAFRLYPLKYAATGFLRIRSDVLRRMIERLDLPLCNTKWGRGFWPLFQPLIVPDGEGGYHYLGEDWAFSHRLAQIGVTPLADTSIRLWHYGRYGFGWEDVGGDRRRYASHLYRTTDPGAEQGEEDLPRS